MITNAYRDPFLNELLRGSCALAGLLKSIQTASQFLDSDAVTAMYAAVSAASQRQQLDLEVYREHLRDAKLEEAALEEEDEEADA